MLLENLSLCLGIFILIFIILLLIISKGFFKEIFKSENYIKFVQLIIVAVLLFVFIAIFIYFWTNEIEVDKMGVVFTVIVGWLGLIIGAFFGQKFMEGLTKEKEKSREMLNILEDYEEQIKILKK